MQNRIIVIGAGIAGLSCIEAIFQDYQETRSHINEVILLSNSRLIKRVTNFKSTGRQLDCFDVTECTIDDLKQSIPDGLEFKFVVGSVEHVDPKNKIVSYFDHNEEKYQNIHYDRLCVCLGSKPRQLTFIESFSKNVKDRVIIIRDVDTINDFQRKLINCKSLAIVGNGGIGLELISKITKCDKTWIIRDDFMGHNYFDSGAAKFLLDSISQTKYPIIDSKPDKNNIIYSELEENNTKKANFGPSLGPSWSQNLNFIGNGDYSNKKLDIVYNDEVVEIIENNDDQHEYYLKVITKNGKEIYCDLVACAIGVEPNKLKILDSTVESNVDDGGILIDNQMRTSIESIYAAGDIVSCKKWTFNNDLWFQMRLWTQARQMGYYAGRCISSHILNSNPLIYFNFDCFTHCTSFFNYKIVLLGKYNGQFLNFDGQKYEIIARVNHNKDYVKIIINEGGKIVGAVLIGESGLEETIENLIHDQIDVSEYKERLLDDTIDIEDYFD